MDVFVKVERVVDVRDCGLQIADRLNDGRDNAPQPVVQQSRRSRQRLESRVGQGRVRDRYRVHAQRHRLAASGGLYRHHEGHLVLRATAVVGLTRPTKVGIVNLRAPGQHPRSLTLDHDLQQLGLHQPGGSLAHSEIALQSQRRLVGLGLRHQMHGQEPSLPPHLVVLNTVPQVTVNSGRRCTANTDILGAHASRRCCELGISSCPKDLDFLQQIRECYRIFHRNQLANI